MSDLLSKRRNRSGARPRQVRIRKAQAAGATLPYEVAFLSFH
jgi:hypothetical protein